MRAHNAIFSLLAFSNCAIAVDLPSFVQPGHQASLKKYIGQHPSLSIATDLLCSCEEGLTQYRKEEPAFQPYYAVGDVNDDGIEDFAVGLVDAKSSSAFPTLLNIAIFHGPFLANRPAQGLLVVKKYPVTRPGEILSVFEARVENSYRFGARLDLGPGPFGSDDHWVIHYNWKFRKYVVTGFYDKPFTRHQK